MKLRWRHRVFFYVLVSLLYGSGIITYVWQKLASSSENPLPGTSSLLHVHGIFGLFWLFFFGYLWRMHIEPAFRSKRKRTTGLLLTACVLFLSLSVIPLYYVSHETTRSTVAFLHIWVGILCVLPFLVHALIKE